MKLEIDFKKGHRFSDSGGFTLIELLLVIAIIGILAALLMSSLSSAKQTGYKTLCASNLKQWGIALTMYAADNQNKFPDLSYQDSSGNATGTKDLAWMPVSFNVGFFPGYLSKNNPGSKGNVRPITDVIYCPTDVFHRDIEANPPPDYQTNLIGYNYLPGRDAAGGITVNYGSDGLGGWATNRSKMGGPYHLAPIMADRLQYNLANQSWLQVYNGKLLRMRIHPNGRGVPMGVNFLYEDGQVSWQKFTLQLFPLVSTGIGVGCRSPGFGGPNMTSPGDYLDFYKPDGLSSGPW